MTREKVFEKLGAIFREEFDKEDIHITETTTAKDIEGWDSLAHIGLMVAIESEFDMKFTMDEVANMKNVGEIANIILQRIG